MGLISCSTFQGQYQTLKVVTDPPGAEVYMGSELLDKTPTFIQIPRAKQKSLLIKFPSRPDITLDLETKYRWGDSFAGNFLFVWFWPMIPVGWSIDMYTQAAWNYEALPRIALGGEKRSEPLFATRMRRVVIAPPKGVGRLLGDEIAKELEKEIHRKYKNVFVEPYFKSLSMFRRHGYEEESLSVKQRESLYAALHSSSESKVKPTHILETVVSDLPEALKVEGSVVDMYTDENTAWSLQIPKTKFKHFCEDSFEHIGRQVVLLMPNSLGLSVGQGVSSVKDDLTGYSSEEIHEGNPFSYLSNISIKNLKASQSRGHWRFHYGFVSSADANYKRLRFKNNLYNAIEHKRFDWYHFLFGVGPQVGVQTPGGLIYAEVVPSVAISHVTWDGSKNDTRGLLGWQSEFGYLYFLSSRITFRLFVNTSSMSTDQWNHVVHDAGATNFQTKEIVYSRGGFSFGYFFPEAQSASRNWVSQ